jgi:hypothetical protein
MSESGYMPIWVGKSSDYWKAADEYERANGRLYKTIEFALPIELSTENQIKVVKEFAESITGKERLPYSWAIHDDPDNPHCHLMVSERVNDGIERNPAQWFARFNPKNIEIGGARKTESLKPVEWLEAIRSDWALLCNRALEQSGELVRIDHRSLKEQRSDLEPGVHIGVSAVALERKGFVTERGNRNRAVKEINDKKEVVKQLEHELEELEIAEEARKVSEARQREALLSSWAEDFMPPDLGKEQWQRAHEEAQRQAAEKARLAAEEKARLAAAEKARLDAEAAAEKARLDAEVEESIRLALESEVSEKSERDARICRLADKIAAEQKDLRKQYEAALVEAKKLKEAEPEAKGLFARLMGKPEGHEAWQEAFGLVKTNVYRLWEACGGNMDAPDHGTAEADRRLTPEYARRTARKQIEAEEAQKYKEQAAEREAQREAQLQKDRNEAHLRDTVELEVGKRVTYHTIGGEETIEGEIFAIREGAIEVRFGEKLLSLQREKCYFTEPAQRPEPNLLDEMEADLARTRHSLGTVGFELDYKKARKMRDITRCAGISDDEFADRCPAATDVLDRAASKEQDRGR